MCGMALKISTVFILLGATYWRVGTLLEGSNCLLTIVTSFIGIDADIVFLWGGKQGNTSKSDNFQT